MPQVRQAPILLALMIVLFIGACAAPGRIDNTRLGLLALGCTVLLACGVLTPMIEVEARISELRFMFLAFCLAALLTSTLIDSAVNRNSPQPDRAI